MKIEEITSSPDSESYQNATDQPQKPHDPKAVTSLTTPTTNTQISRSEASIVLLKNGSITFFSNLVAKAGALGGSIMLSKIDTDNLAASGLITTTKNVFQSPSASLLVATALMTGQADKPEVNDSEKVGKIYRQSLVLSLTLLTIPAECLLVFCDPILQAVGQQKAIAAIVQSHFRAFAWGYPFNMILTSNNQVCMGLLKQGVVFTTNLCQQVLNLGLGYMLTFGKGGLPKLGAAGFGYANSISAIVTCIGSTIYLATNSDYKKYKLFSRQNHGGWQIFIDQLKLGTPMAIQAFFELFVFMANAQIAGNLGTHQLAATEIAAQYAMVEFLTILSLAQNCGILVSRSREQHPENVRRIGNTGIALSLIAPSLLMVIYLATPNALASLFTTDEDISNITVLLLMLTGVGQFFDAVRYTCSRSLSGLKDTCFSMATTIGISSLVALPLAYYFSVTLDLKAAGLLIATDLSSALGAAAMLWRWCRIEVKPPQNTPITSSQTRKTAFFSDQKNDPSSEAIPLTINVDPSEKESAETEHVQQSLLSKISCGHCVIL